MAIVFRMKKPNANECPVGFSLQEVGGIKYIDSYSHNGYTIPKHPSVLPENRPILDEIGIRFQNNNRSLLMGQPIPHKQVYIVANCLENLQYRSSGNQFYTARNKAMYSSLQGMPNSKRIDAQMHTNGFVMDLNSQQKTNFGVVDNASPIGDFKLIVADVDFVCESALIIGGGANFVGTSTFILRSLNGYIKDFVLLDEILTGQDQDDFIAQEFLV